MASLRSDQAEGLRRLLERSALRVLSIGAAAGGASGAVLNLAAALAESGSEVLILDAQPAGRGVAAALGLNPRFDLEDVIARRRDLDEVITRAPGGVLILPLARGVGPIARLPAREQQRLIERCGRLGYPVDTLLIDAGAGGALTPLWPDRAARETIVLAGASAAAITSAYALIKQLANEHARREFHLLVGEVANETEARTIFANMAGAARRYLQVRLDFMGHVPADEKLRQAARLRLPVVTAFPRSAAATGFRRLARAIDAWPRTDAEGCGFDEFMRRFIHSNSPPAAAA